MHSQPSRQNKMQAVYVSENHRYVYIYTILAFPPHVLYHVHITCILADFHVWMWMGWYRQVAARPLSQWLLFKDVFQLL